jgi:predicted nucleotidyltransferase
MAEDRQQQLDRLVRLIVDEVGPLRVVLFGSAARGESTETSDVDLLVVVPDGTPRRRTAMRIYGSVTDVTLPFDIVVATPGDLEKYGASPGLIYHHILRDGRELSAA